MTTPHQAAAGVAATGDVAYDFNASINDVIETLANGVHGYTAAAKQLDDVDTQHTFHELAASRRNVTEQVVRAATDEGLDVDGDVDGTAVGAMHRAWIAVEGTIAGDSSVVESAITGETHAKEVLEDALEHAFPEPVRAALRNALTDVETSLRRLESTVASS